MQPNLVKTLWKLSHIHSRNSCNRRVFVTTHKFQTQLKFTKQSKKKFNFLRCPCIAPTADAASNRNRKNATFKETESFKLELAALKHRYIVKLQMQCVPERMALFLEFFLHFFFVAFFTFQICYASIPLIWVGFLHASNAGALKRRLLALRTSGNYEKEYRPLYAVLCVPVCTKAKIGSLCWRCTSNKPKKASAQMNVFEGMRS